MSNPFRFSKGVRTINNPRYMESPPPINEKDFKKKILPAAIHNQWVTCDDLNCRDLPELHFGPYAESGQYITGADSNARSTIDVRIPIQNVTFSANGVYTIDRPYGTNSQITINVPQEGAGGCDYRIHHLFSQNHVYTFPENMAVAAGTTVALDGGPGCNYIVFHDSTDHETYTFNQDVAIAAGSSITFLPNIPLPLRVLGIFVSDTPSVCPLEYAELTQGTIIPPDADSIEIQRGTGDDIKIYALFYVSGSTFGFVLFRDDFDADTHIFSFPQQTFHSVFVIPYKRTDDQLAFCALAALFNDDRTFVLSSCILTKVSTPPFISLSFNSDVTVPVYETIG